MVALHLERSGEESLRQSERITKQEEDLKEEEDHLLAVLRMNGYPARFIYSVTSHTAPATQPTEESEDNEQEEKEKSPSFTISYMAGVSERIRRTCKKFNINVFFKSGPTLRSMLSRVKDPLPMEK